MDERAQILNFLLSSCDQKNQKIAELEAKITQLELSRPKSSPESKPAIGKDAA